MEGWRLRGPGLREGQKPQRWDIRPVGHQSPGGVLGGAVGAEPGHAGSRRSVNVAHANVDLDSGWGLGDASRKV